ETSSVEQAFVLTPAEAPQARSEDSSRACVSTYQATTTPLNPCSRSTVLSRANPHSPHSAENTKRMALRSGAQGPIARAELLAAIDVGQGARTGDGQPSMQSGNLFRLQACYSCTYHHAQG
ncbi:uncharacterized protein CCOS01_16256, partial [Colletotrichum costaricense]